MSVHLKRQNIFDVYKLGSHILAGEAKTGCTLYSWCAYTTWCKQYLPTFLPCTLRIFQVAEVTLELLSKCPISAETSISYHDENPVCDLFGAIHIIHNTYSRHHPLIYRSVTLPPTISCDTLHNDCQP